MSVLDKILVGLANANPNYGVSPRGRLTAQILQEIWDIGVKRVDSATEYPHAAEVVSESNLGWRVQTKVKLPEAYNSFENLEQAASLAIGNTKVESLLIHTPNLYQHERANHIVSDLKRIAEVLEIPKVGISIYRPVELELLKNWQNLDLIQFPHNPLDSNCFNWLTLSNQKRLPILQVRSIYLQGFLIPQKIPNNSLPAELLTALSLWKNWLVDFKLNAQMYCAAFACGNPRIDEIVVGVDSSAQLSQLIENIVDAEELPRYSKIVPEQLTDPRRWTH
jgi:aryl-alcohol dehydrogenase-like predicted oxidoreductase